ncbi:hypothetical protein [Oribacterium sp. WCC10]|uniref:hypothetical protein n=1 Tax=Oribacterium sp. WCC10 TaxID=1855343 RepID=UPI0008EE46B4|nr:hypothetical protein [Oribacterium sp. WCC10]SFG79501.1 hypothetical protein SAMN05216356_1303 [Oribacterium sp. WCC10]
MNQNRIIIYIILILLIGVFILTGCGHSSLEDVYKYVNDMDLGLCIVNPIHKVLESQDEYGPDDWSWTVYQIDTGIKFNIVDSGTDSILGVQYSLRDDYNECLLDSCEEEFPEYDDITYDKLKNEISFSFGNKRELRKRCDEIYDIYSVAHDKYKNAYIRVNCNIENSFTDRYKNTYQQGFVYKDDLDYSVNEKRMEDDSIYKYCLMEYCDIALNYRLEDVLGELTDDDIRMYMNRGYTQRIIYILDGTKEDLKNAKKEVDSELVGHSGVMEYANLYYLLKKQGFNIEGTKDDFKVRNTDGKKCEFSYDFSDDDQETSYYLVDGEKIYTRRERYFGLYEEEIEELFGIKTYFLTNDQITHRKNNNNW